MKVILSGLPASLGNGTGIPHVLRTDEDINSFKEGEILVAEMTRPEWVPAMAKAKAIVTENGGRTCHAAIVSRELHIPCVTSAKKAIEILPRYSLVTVAVTTTKGDIWA